MNVHAHSWSFVAIFDSHKVRKLHLQFFLLSNIFAIVWKAFVFLSTYLCFLAYVSYTNVSETFSPLIMHNNYMVDSFESWGDFSLSHLYPVHRIGIYYICHGISFLTIPSILPGDDEVHALYVCWVVSTMQLASSIKQMGIAWKNRWCNTCNISCKCEQLCLNSYLFPMDIETTDGIHLGAMKTLTTASTDGIHTAFNYMKFYSQTNRLHYDLFIMYAHMYAHTDLKEDGLFWKMKTPTCHTSLKTP